jgi:DNA-binding XRE family transcriptional regulator
LKTIGDHIRAWRLDNNLLQADVAKILSVCKDTIIGWEMPGTVPTAPQMPQIIKMIGYMPLSIDTSAFAGRITYYLYTQGITPKEFGELIPVDA